MNGTLFSAFCSGLTYASLINSQAREIGSTEGHQSRFVYNMAQAMSLSLIFETAMSMRSHTTFSQTRFFSIVFGIPLMCSLLTTGLSCIANCTNYLTDEIEAVERNMGNIIDIAVRISSVALLILLMPHARHAKISFAIAFTAVAINLGLGCSHYSSERGSQQQIGQREE